MVMYDPILDNQVPGQALDVLCLLAKQLTTNDVDVEAIARLSSVAIRTLFPDARCEIRLLQSNVSLRLVGGEGLPDNYVQRFHALAVDEGTLQGDVTLRQTALFVTDATTLPEGNRQHVSAAGASSLALLPLRTHDHQIGTLGVFLPHPHLWGAAERASLTLLAELVTLGLSRVMTIQEQQGQHHKEDIFTSISHALRTPLTAIQGYLELIDRKSHQHSLEPSMYHYLTVALQQTHVLADCIDQLLDVALIEDNRMELTPAPVRPDSLLEDVVHQLQGRFTNRELESDLVPASQEAVWDAVRVSQIVHHIVKNAVMYSEPPAPIEVTMRYAGPLVVIMVRDFGQGIAPEHHERIFDRFWRGVDNSITKQAYGLGLGLYLSKALTHIHGGHLLVQSKGVPGQGTTFTIELPWRVPVA